MPLTHATPGPEARFAQTLAAYPAATAGGPIGLCVSGGGDSIAMMHLAARHLAPQNLHIVSVDHGLRPEAADELALVARQAKALGLSHRVLHWHWDGAGNLQAAARAGRMVLIADWAGQGGITTVWLGHTEDDQIETFLMRLARGSGIDGLAGMSTLTKRYGVRIFRPLLDVARADLRDWLRANDIAWCDDPSNQDPGFDRVRARQMIAPLGDLGLTRKRILQTVDHMQAARLSLVAAARDFAQDHVAQDRGDLVFDAAALDLEKHDLPRRVMAAAFGWVGGQTYRPRFEQLLDVAHRARHGEKTTLGGCILTAQGGGLFRLTREAAATAAQSLSCNQTGPVMRGIWDHRWELKGPAGQCLTFAALGEGIRNCPDWRATGLPRDSLRASPAVWQDDRLVAAPVAGLPQGWSARIVADFHSTAFAIED